jgi:hypothetical protein
VILVTVAWAASFASYRLVERRFLALKRRHRLVVPSGALAEPG